MSVTISTILCIVFLASCKQSEPGPASGLLRCDVATTPVAAVQGEGYASTLVDTDVTISGLVTRLEPGKGFYLEEPDSDASPRTSNAIFIESAALSGVSIQGQMMVVSGRVTELGEARDTLTALTGISAAQPCDAAVDFPQFRVELPLDSRQREAIEGMRIILDQELTVIDVYNLHRGEVILNAKGELLAPVEIGPPGPSAVSMAKKNREWSVPTAIPGSKQAVIPRGTTVTQINGIMGNKGTGQIFLLELPLGGNLPHSTGLRTLEKNNIRMASFNLLNYFNGDGEGGGFPTARGAKTHDDFLAQAKRIRSAISIMQPHLLAVQELENDGFGPQSAARSLVELLNASGQGKWSAVETESARIGGDVITVGLFYRSDRLATVGPAYTLDSKPFQNLSRQPLAQLFEDRSSGQSFLVASNHFKSKGSCQKTGENADQRDGQGCWNPARVAAAKAVSEWMNGLAVKSGTNRILIFGDMNAARFEDPVRTLRDHGFTELVEQFSDLPQYTHVYKGEAATLDYAFASEALLSSVSHAEIWHINAGWPQKMELPDPWLRSSDHDPVVVDLDFSQSDTSD